MKVRSISVRINTLYCLWKSLSLSERGGMRIRDGHRRDSVWRDTKAQWLISRIPIPSPSAKVFLRGKGEWISSFYSFPKPDFSHPYAYILDHSVTELGSMIRSRLMSSSQSSSEVGESEERIANSTCDFCSGGSTATPISTPVGNDKRRISKAIMLSIEKN